jgi:hypothetical protein
MVEQAQNLQSRFPFIVRRHWPRRWMRQNVRLQDFCATFNRAWYVELEPESSPCVAFAMKLETTTEPLFLEVEEAKQSCW